MISRKLAVFLPLLAAFWLLPPLATAQRAASTTQDARRLVTAEEKGHCQACHQFPNDPEIKSRATVGPALTGLRSRFPDRQRLIAVIRDARDANPDTIMPPYGPHRILTDGEIAAIADYLWRQ